MRKESTMSLEMAKAAIDRMKSDEEFRQNIIAIDGVELRMKAINTAGFDCTEGEIQQIAVERGFKADRETGAVIACKDIFAA